jgi:hypothetical protein
VGGDAGLLLLSFLLDTGDIDFEIEANDRVASRENGRVLGLL